MNRGTIRSIGIFAAVAIVLLALVIGGVRLVKERNTQYASRAQGLQQAPPAPQSQPPQANNPQTQNPAPQQQTPAPQQTPQSQPTPTQTTPAPTATPTPAPQQQNHSTAPAQVPVTGPAEDTLVTVALMMLAVYFAYLLKRAKLSYRRLLS